MMNGQVRDPATLARPPGSAGPVEQFEQHQVIVDVGRGQRDGE
ncbi:hypothetical protein [Nocardia sp. CDC160]|nr:hypothetical protein [Nocardia sp. CDC160]MEC3920294.1 hypothetical protein [Nocardia sp. CDC160]